MLIQTLTNGRKYLFQKFANVSLIDDECLLEEST